jgi:hypothetical protein
MKEYEQCPHAWTQIEHDKQETSRGTSEITVLECIKCFARRTTEEFRKTPTERELERPSFLVSTKETIVLRREVQIEAANVEEAVQKANQLLAIETPSGEVALVSREIEAEEIPDG